MRGVEKIYAVILTAVMATVLAPVETMAGTESEALEWQEKQGGYDVSSEENDPNFKKWVIFDPTNSSTYLTQPTPKLDTYYYYVDATGKPLIKYNTEDGWFDATGYIKECITWEVDNYSVNFSVTQPYGATSSDVGYIGCVITKKEFEETLGYEPSDNDKVPEYGRYADSQYPLVYMMAEGTKLTKDDFYCVLSGLGLGDDLSTLNDPAWSGFRKIEDGYFIGANAPAWESAELTGDTTIHRGTNWLTYTGTTKWGDTYTVTFPVVGQPKPMVTVEEENTEIEEDEIDLVPVPHTRKVPIAILGVPLGGALVAFFWMKNRKIKFHGIFDAKNDNIIIKGKAAEEKKNDWFIPSINERLVNHNFNVKKYVEALENCGVLSLFPIDTQMFVHAELYSGEIYSVKTKANEKLLFKTLTELEDRVVGPVEVILANSNKHINIKINYFI